MAALPLLAGAAAVALWAPPAHSQSTIVVTGARVPVALDRLAADVLVIDADRIAASRADSLEDLLRREAGLQMQRNGGPGATAGVSIRGANSGQTLVLVDGVRIGAATTGQTEFEGLSLAHIERIEVLRGPASSLYGADAVGGVVQIFTRRGDDRLQLRGSLGAGAYGARESAGSATWGNGAVDAALSLSDERLQGVSVLRPGDQFGNYNPDRDGFLRQGVSARLAVMLSPWQRLSLQGFGSQLNAKYDSSEFLPPSFAQNALADFRNVLDLRSAALAHDATWSPEWRTQVQLSRQSSDLLAGASRPARFRTDRQREEAQATWSPGGQQQLTLVLDHLNETARSGSYANTVERSNRGLGLAWSNSWGGLSLQAEARHDDNSQFGGVNTGRLGASWKLAPNWRLRSLLGTTFRAVSFNDLYFPNYGVATLNPERGRSAELGLVYQGTDAAGTRLAATVYRNEVRDLVRYEPDRKLCPAGNYSFGCARNVGQARLQGATFEGRTTLGAFALRGTLDFLDAKDQATGERLPRRAAHQERLGVDWDGGAFKLGADALRVGARPESGKQLAAATTLDLQARWTLAAGWQAQAQVRNATNRDFEPARDYQVLGRQLWFGLRWENS